jgi:hypothetical protein
MDMELKGLIKKFCAAPTMADIPLRLKPGLAPTEDLVARAQKKLRSTPADRATAIAVIQGV